MLSVGRRGFTLLEIIVSTTMLLVASGALYQTLRVTQRLSRRQAQQVNLQSNVRSAALILANEFRSLGTGLGPGGNESDLVSMAPAAVVYRAERGFGLLCRPSSSSRLGISRTSFSGHRDPQARQDSASVFLEGDPASPADDIWLPVAITAVGSGSCAGGQTPAIELTIAPASLVEGLPPGTPVRIHELVELRLYRSDGRSWLGMRSVSSNENIQPLAGPLRNGDGLRLDYLSGAGSPASTNAEVRGIRFTLHGESEGVVHFGAQRGEAVADSLSVHVALRNAH